MKEAVYQLVDEVLNHPDVLDMCYRTLSLPKLLTLLSMTSTNVLFVGEKQSWIICAKAMRKRQFVGTTAQIGLNGTNQWPSTWKRLHEFVLRYATRGAIIRVYSLHGSNVKLWPVSEMRKVSKSAV